MASVYTADQSEAQLAREAFGPTVTEVVFYDPEFPGDGDPWYAIGYAGDTRLGVWTEGDSPNLRAIVAGRGETVKFWIEIGAGQ